MKVVLSDLTLYKLDLLSDYLIQEWSTKTFLKFIKRFNRKIKSIETNPFIYPELNEIKDVRKCVVSKQCYFLYEVNENTIIVLTLTDSRQEPEKIRNEILKYLQNRNY